ncbi:MAG: hypothetical protein WBP10_14135 [Thermoanaerobaculia bacterium]
MRTTVILFLAGLMGLYTAAASTAQPQIHFLPDQVRVTGLTPGEHAVVFGVARVAIPWAERVVPRARVIRADGVDGSAELNLDRAVPQKSIWTVVDAMTGEFALAAPEGFPLREKTFDVSKGLAVGPDGLLNRLTAKSKRLFVVLVRPEVSAWRVIVTDGGPADDDSDDNGAVRVRLDEAEDLSGRGLVLSEVAVNDVIIGINPRRMAVFAVRLVP